MASLSFLLTLLQMVENDHGNNDGSVSFLREKAVIVGNVLLIVLVNLPHYASDSVIKYNKDESVLIFPNKGIATFISALQIYWIKNQE